MDLYLFTTDEATAAQALAGGIAGFVVDWETAGKGRRQQGAALEENRDTPADVARLKQRVGGRVLCRINGYGPETALEVEAAVDAGADVVFLPMVRRVEEAEAFLDCLGGRAGGAILVETVDAVARAADLARLPLAMAYMGLNDLALDRGRDLFDAVADGTVERVRRAFRDVPFGFAGLTVVDRGAPVPTVHLAAYMGRLGCDFTFLRRSWRADIVGRDVGAEVRALQARIAAPSSEAEHRELLSALARARVHLR